MTSIPTIWPRKICWQRKSDSRPSRCSRRWWRAASGTALVMAVIPGDQELDLQALAAAAGERKIQLVPAKELQGL